MIDIDRQQFVTMEVDLAVRRWEHSTEPGLLTCATSKSFRKHDVPYKRGTQYHLLMRNDIGGYQANHSEMKAGAATSVRGAIRHTNFYCTAVNQLVMDRRQRTFSAAFSSSAYVLRSLRTSSKIIMSATEWTQRPILRRSSSMRWKMSLLVSKSWTLEMWLSGWGWNPCWMRIWSIVALGEKCTGWWGFLSFAKP